MSTGTKLNWDDKLAKSCIDYKYKKALCAMKGLWVPPERPYRPECRLISCYWGIEQEYSKIVRKKIQSYNEYLRCERYR